MLNFTGRHKEWIEIDVDNGIILWIDYKTEFVVAILCWTLQAVIIKEFIDFDVDNRFILWVEYETELLVSNIILYWTLQAVVKNGTFGDLEDQANALQVI